MKLKQWLYGAAALTMMAACSDNLSDGPDAPDNGPTEKATGYLALQINLPQETGTRTRANEDWNGNKDNVDYADGESWEYRVEAGKAKLLLFKTSSAEATENDAEYVDKYDLNRAFAPTSPSDNNITSSSVEAVEVTIDTTKKDTEYLWALVMLNVPDGLSLPTSKQKFGDYITSISTSEFLNGNKGTGSIFMTNAPLSKKPGGTSSPGSVSSETDPLEIQTLVKLGKIKDCLKSSLMDARDNVAGCIYVERGLAKITAKVASTPNIVMYDKDGFVVNESNVEIGNKLNVTVGDSKFGILNANPRSYIVRRTSGWPAANETEQAFAWNFASTAKSPAYYRMIGATGMPELYSPLHPDPQYLYRTYWCLDPNYDVPLTDETSINMTVDQFENTSVGKFYVRENTFTVANQNYGNTTLAAFEITFKVDGSAKDLYIINDNHNAIYTSEADATSHVYEYILAQDKVQKALKESTKPGAPQDETINFGQFLKITFSRDAATGVYSATNFGIDDEATGLEQYYDPEKCVTAFVTNMGGQSAINELVSRVNLLFVIEKYTGGKSYYIIPIQHFGQTSTPWFKNGENQTETGEAYPVPDPSSVNYALSARNFLGRYGLVRNNWYELNVTSFKGIGSPVIPKYEDDLSDDNNEIKQYIGIETHILSWAKRTQKVDFE